MSKKAWITGSVLGLLAVLLCTLGAAAQATAATAPAEALRFPELEFNFGKIPQGKPVFHNFAVVNSSNKAVKIDNVHASCGCTTPEWSREDIQPGANSNIKVGYNAAAEGPFDKTITVAYGNETKVLRIKGEVWKTPVTAAPPNAAVLFLRKQLEQ